ncbi:MAG: hypothetical protein J6A52_01500 [Bacilli bacterium]|nr:hypothetical protein [Bacilli bacterium]
MQYVVDWNKLDELGNELIMYADFDLTNQVNLIMNLKNSATWEGDTAVEVMQEFTNLMQQVQKMILATKKYGLFLKNVADKYKQTNNKVRNTFEADVVSAARF